MASKGASAPLRRVLLFEGRNGTLRPRTSHSSSFLWSRGMATETTIPPVVTEGTSLSHPDTGLTKSINSNVVPEHLIKPELLTTVYSFPSIEPLHFKFYTSDLLGLPLRRDILHRAVIYEGDNTRQGTASTKIRSEVRGSTRKIRPQKGTGQARLGDKKSPMLRGGGVAFGPKPRDFGTDLPRKIYDLAWRTALSYRYRRGELILIDTVKLHGTYKTELAIAHYLKELLRSNGWGKDNRRSTIITASKKKRVSQILGAVERISMDAKGLEWDDVDVKDLLETGRLIIEEKALDNILAEHQHDLWK